MSDRTPEEIERDAKIAEEAFGKPQTPTQSSFSNAFSPPADYKPDTLDVNDAEDAVQSAQQKLVKSLSNDMADTTLANIKALAPLDKFEIPEGSGLWYSRQKVRPKDLRELRKAQDEYFKAVKNTEISNEDKLEKEFQLIFVKAKVYLGMTEAQFDETDYELLQQVIQATELRTQGFRKRQ